MTKTRTRRSSSFSPVGIPFFKSSSKTASNASHVVMALTPRGSVSSSHYDSPVGQTRKDPTGDQPERRSSFCSNSGKSSRRRNSSASWNQPVVEPGLSRAQKQGCFNHIKRRHSIALAFAQNQGTVSLDENMMSHCSDTASTGSIWEYVKTKQGVEMYKSKRSRCEVRGVTLINASVKNVMSLLASGETTERFEYAQNILMGSDNVLEARVLSSCVPSTASRYFHCALKYMAMKNPFGLSPLDLVFLDYTDVSTTPDGKLVGYRIIESIRVPEFGAVSKYIRASIRCEVYIVRETDKSGVVEVTFASHLDPKSKYSSSKRSTWLDQTVVRLSNLRSYAEKASFSHRLVLETGKLVKGDARRNCLICESSFSFLRKRHNCRLCGEVTCGRCSRKLPILVGTETTRVRVCLCCMLESREQPDELGRAEVECPRGRGSLGNSTFIVQLNQRVGVGAVGRPASFGCSIQQRHKVTVPSAAGAVRRSRLKPKLPKAKCVQISALNHMPASMLIRTNSKEFLLEVVDAKQQIHLTSPISGLRMYEWNARTRRWEDEVFYAIEFGDVRLQWTDHDGAVDQTDAHDIEGLLTRDLMRLCSGVPAF
ncbi:TPA: hypothetical protein N0F65_005826 [Lagenidium giganteum]|uniref:FYVE-type domain-containing protein n=1 Tax=Lagenidium giganteum TaxID=4803 RepID=A0AAV2YPR2_9STRA|nr:TPA: hypothetical protein N0F65_005826 [Lagenidium giganteum]